MGLSEEVTALYNKFYLTTGEDPTYLLLPYHLWAQMQEALGGHPARPYTFMGCKIIRTYDLLQMVFI